MHDGVFSYLFYVIYLTPESFYFLVIVKLLKVVLVDVFKSVNGENKKLVQVLFIIVNSLVKNVARIINFLSF